jgi:6-phosphogluconolactonase
MKHHERLLLAGLGSLALAAAAGCAASDAAPSAPSPSAATTTTVYVGTYTDAGSRGIYRLAFDPATGTLGAAVLAGEARNPSFLALHPSGRFLYAVNETDDFDAQHSGSVSSFAVDAKTGDLTLLNQQASGGAHPCHLAVDRAGRNLLVANYSGGTVAVLPIGADGRLAPASSIRAHEGSGPNKARQEKPHAHGISLDTAERFAFAADLGADRIFVYRFDAAKSTLEPHGSASLAPGSGPRHLAFDPAGRFLYSIDELTSTITAFAYDPAQGLLSPQQTVPTLPLGWSGDNSTAELAFTTDGRFLYGSNRGHDSLALFSVDAASGRLTPAGHAPAGGAAPRHFSLDPSGRFVLIAHQGSGSIASFRLDGASGQLTPTGQKATISKPVCVLPVR